MKADVFYLKEEAAHDALARSECRLDVYLPSANFEPFPMLVWFHGGAFKGGSKNSNVSVQVAKSLAARGIGVVVPEYRKNPAVQFPVYIEDCAEAVRWSVEEAGALGARSRIFVGGHSAGAYIAALLAMDERFLTKARVNEERIAGYIAMSGQMTTHATVAEERGFNSKAVTADDAAPIQYLRKGVKPVLLLVGDDDWPARLEENRYFYEVQRKVGGNRNISFFIIENRTHSTVLKGLTDPEDPASKLLMEFLQTGVLPDDGMGPVELPDEATLVDPTVGR